MSSEGQESFTGTSSLPCQAQPLESRLGLLDPSPDVVTGGRWNMNQSESLSQKPLVRTEGSGSVWASLSMEDLPAREAGRGLVHYPASLSHFIDEEKLRS